MASTFQGFRSLVENGSDAVSLIDTRGEILYASASAARIFGYRPEQLVGRNSMELLHPDDRNRMLGMLPVLFAEPAGLARWNARVRRNDGSLVWVESIASNMLLDPEVKAIAVIYRDISARIAAEAKAKKEAESLVLCNQRLEEFAYTVAHDLREPLRTISSFTQMLMRNLERDEENKRIAEFAVDAARRMSTLLDDLLSLASTGLDEPPGIVDLEDALAEAKQNLALALTECHAVLTTGPLPQVHGNRDHLVRVFQNLIGNSLKYRGGNVPAVDVSAERQASRWVISVRDNGIGIAPEDHKRIFGLFTRLHGRDISGTGIGLAFCKKIVEAAGDRIWVESRKGSGSTFCFTVAAIGQTAPAARGVLHVLKAKGAA
jgi:chemotaxis family two-component system sensor kinase Cph1